MMAAPLVAALCCLALVSAVPDTDAVRFPGLSAPPPPSSPFPSSLLAAPAPAPAPSRGIAPCFRNQTFCEFSPDYPHEVDVDSDLLQNSLIKAKIFESKGGRVRSRGDIQARFGLGGGGEPVRACRVRRRTIFPKKACQHFLVSLTSRCV